MNSRTFLLLLSDYVQGLPFLLIALAGVIFALVFWRRHPKVSLFTLLWLTLAIVYYFLDPAVYFWLLERASQKGESLREGTLYLPWADSLLISGQYALLLVAVFGWRGSCPPLSRKTVVSLVLVSLAVFCAAV